MLDVGSQAQEKEVAKEENRHLRRSLEMQSNSGWQEKGNWKEGHARGTCSRGLGLVSFHVHSPLG